MLVDADASIAAATTGATTTAPPRANPAKTPAPHTPRQDPAARNAKRTGKVVTPGIDKSKLKTDGPEPFPARKSPGEGRPPVAPVTPFGTAGDTGVDLPVAESDDDDLLDEDGVLERERMMIAAWTCNGGTASP